MKHQGPSQSSACHDAAVAAAMIMLEEFFPHCPNGIAEAIHGRMTEIVETAIESARAARWQERNEPSEN